VDREPTRLDKHRLCWKRHLRFVSLFRRLRNVEDLPLPTPLITRPRMSIERLTEANWRTAPRALMRAPHRSVFFRPRRSPSRAASRHPTKFPSEKELAVMPWMSGSLVSGKTLRKSSLIKMPLVMPWSYPYQACKMRQYGPISPRTGGVLTWPAEFAAVKATSNA